MKFHKTLSSIDSPRFDQNLEEELRKYIYLIDVRQLTRCGGHASDPTLVSITSVIPGETHILVECQIEFNDGSALDCSGHCGGTVSRQPEILRVNISRESGQAEWETLDGVVTGF